MSCKYFLKESPARAARSASILLSITRNGSRKLRDTGPGSFLASLKTSSKDKTIPGIAGATDTGADGDAYSGTAAAQFGDDRIASVIGEANSPVADAGYHTSTKIVDVLKEFLAKGA